VTSCPAVPCLPQPYPCAALGIQACSITLSQHNNTVTRLLRLGCCRVVISLFGAISATVACFCVPAAVVLAQHAASKWDLGKGLLKACAVLVFALGKLMSNEAD
jgi:hypothetical protein